jgi:hypothetical protein
VAVGRHAEQAEGPHDRDLQPPLHKQQHPLLVGVMGYRLEDQVVIKIVKEVLDI